MQAAPFYSSSDWKALRARFLSAHPHCRVCTHLGFHVRAIEVDHIIPMDQGGARLDARNLQALCKMHHGQKTRAQHAGMQLLVFDANGQPVPFVGVGGHPQQKSERRATVPLPLHSVRGKW